jgi:hypothetical protein
MLTVTVKAEQVVTRAFGIARHLYHLVCKSEAVQFQPDAVHALAIMIAGRILAGNSDEVLAKSQDGLSVSIERLLQVVF